MNLHSLYRPASAHDIDKLVAEHPLAQIVSCNDGHFAVSALPLLLERTEEGAFLLGHFDRNNPQVPSLRTRPHALALFTGAHGYISPSWRGHRRIAPTWNYAQVRFEVRFEFQDTPKATREVLQKLVSHMEAGRPEPWSIRDMGTRYADQARNVIAFRARVLSTDASFKLGQNEDPDNLAAIIAQLQRDGQTRLAEAMTAAADAAADPRLKE